MSFSCFYTPTRSEYKTKRKKNISVDNKEKVRIPIFDKNFEEKSIFIPKYYIFDVTYFNDNYLILKDKDNNINIYITPLIRTLLNDINSFVKKDESLARTIKERINPSARRLIKKSVEKSSIVIINSKQFIKINTEIKQTDKDNHYAIGLC